LAWAAATLAFAWCSAAPWEVLFQHVELAHEDTAAVFSLEKPEKAAPTAFLQDDVHKNKDNPLVDVVVGLICAAVSFSLLWLNEGHAARMDQLMIFLHRRTRDVPAAPADAQNLRHPVFINGEGRTDNTLVLEEWGNLTAPPNSAKLRAMSFMFQWEEEKDDNNTKYNQCWKHHRVESERFQYKEGHVNPDFPVSPTTVELSKVNVGSFVLSKRMLGKLQNYEACSISDDIMGRIESEPRMQNYQRGVKTMFSYSMRRGSRDAVFFAQRVGGGTDATPAIGDMMVLFEYAPCGPISLLGVQVPYDEHHTSKILVPGTRCEVNGLPAEISEVTPPPQPFQVHYMGTAAYEANEWVEADAIHPLRDVRPWPADPDHWTFVPVQFTESKLVRPTLTRAHTGNTNVADSKNESLLGENEVDNYIEEERSVLAHLEHGVTQFGKTVSRTLNPVSLARAFLEGSSPDEICLAFPGTYTFHQAMAKEKNNEQNVNAGVRLFGFILMYLSFNLMLRPLTWLLSFLWIFGTVLIWMLHTGTLMCACVCSGCTMATAWIAYRPIYAFGLFIVPLIILYLQSKASESQDHW